MSRTTQPRPAAGTVNCEQRGNIITVYDNLVICDVELYQDGVKHRPVYLIWFGDRPEHSTYNYAVDQHATLVDFELQVRPFIEAIPDRPTGKEVEELVRATKSFVRRAYKKNVVDIENAATVQYEGA